MVDEIEAASSKLGEAATLAEEGFLAAGQCLERAIGILDKLSGRFAEYVATLTGDALKDTRHDLAAISTQTATLGDTCRSDMAALDALRDITADSGRCMATLVPVVREVEILSLNSRVVAGGMGTAAADFSVFAGSISDAAKLARSCLYEARHVLSQVDQDLATAQAAATSFAKRHGPAMQSIPLRLAENLHSIEAQQQLAADAAIAARRQSDAVRGKVAEQIVALQLGDVIRQRVEHVQAAVHLLAAPDREVGQLLAAQLDDAADELGREGEQVEAGLRQLGGAARAIGQLSLDVHGETDAHNRGFLAVVQADIQQTSALLDELSAGDAATDRCMAAVLDAVVALTKHMANVQSVQEDIRIMGLNAALKCGRLGTAGKPLAAIAQELRLCSASFGRNADEILQDLEKLTPVANRLRDPTRRAAHSAIAQATNDVFVPLRRLSDLEQELAAAIAQLQTDADCVGRLVEDAIARFAVRHELTMTLHEVAEDFMTWPHTDVGSSDTLETIAAGYTMAREREVHARFAPLPQEIAAAELTDILF